MYSRDGGFHALRSFARATMVMGVLGAAVCAISVGNFLKSAGEAEDVLVEPARIGWWTSVRFDFDQPNQPARVPIVQIAKAVDVATVPQISRKAVARRSIRHRLVRRKVSVTPAVIAQAVPDKTAPAEVAVVVASADELAQMRSLHAGLRTSFSLAVNTQSLRRKEPVNIQTEVIVAKATAAKPAIDAPAKVNVGRTQGAVDSKPIAQIAAAPVSQESAAIQADAVNIRTEVATAAKVVVPDSDKADRLTVVSAVKSEEPNRSEVTPSLLDGMPAATVNDGSVAAFKPPVRNVPVLSGRSVLTTQNGTSRGTAATTGVTTRRSKVSFVAGGDTARIVITQSAPSRDIQVLAIAPSKMDTQARVAKVPDTSFDETAEPVALTGIFAAGFRAQDPCASYVEAFEWRTGVCPDKREVLTYEGPNSGQQFRWMRTSLLGHWPTLSWSQAKPGDATKKIPLVSNNAAKLLARLAGGAPIESGAGLVFGRVPSGWNVEFTGRAEHPIFLDSENRPVSDPVLARYFAFVNAAPGFHILYVVSDSGSARAAIGVPVVENTATYVDSGVPVARPLSGKVFDGGAARLRGMPRVGVKVVGQQGRTAIASRDGAFRISDVLVCGDYPLFVETETKDEYTHRYRVLPSMMSNTTLFLFRAAEIRAWLGQLEGGISVESGLVLAALPSVVAQNEKTSLVPIVRPLGMGAALIPETYSISREGALMGAAPFSPGSPRMISLQVPEGANIARVEAPGHKTVWSELFVASPGVVNVLGPW